MAVAICYEAPTRFCRYTCDAGSAIAKGSILQLITPNTADNANAGSLPVAGIAWMETTGSYTSGSVTEVSAALDGTWGIECVGSISVGDQLCIFGSAQVAKYVTLDNEKGRVIGKSLETATGSTVIKLRMDV